LLPLVVGSHHLLAEILQPGQRALQPCGFAVTVFLLWFFLVRLVVFFGLLFLYFLLGLQLFLLVEYASHAFGGCGLAGFLIVSGKDQTIATTSAGGQGFTAIIVAWLAKFNTFYMALISFLLVFLSRGAADIASTYDLNDFSSSIIEGIILFFILGSEFFINYRVIFRGSESKEVAQ